MFDAFIQKIESSPVFNKELYLTSCFFLDQLQFIYYSPITHHLTTFVVEGDAVKILEENQQVFQKQEKILERLDLSLVRIDLDGAQSMVLALLKEKYHKENVSQKILSLHQEQIPYWNVTFILTDLGIFNAKVHAVTQEIISEKMQHAMDFKVI